MFEKEIEEIQRKLVLSLKYHHEAEKLYRRINKLERNSIYYIGLSSKGRYYIYEQANRELKGIIDDVTSNRHNSINISQEGNKKDFKKNVQVLKSVTNDDVLKSLKECLKPNEYEKEIKVNIYKNTAEIQLGEYLLDLLLNSLNIMNSNELETKEIRTKAEQALKNCNTFIYRDIKITVYKNGKMKLVFNNEKVFKKFKEFTSDISSLKEKPAV